MSFLSIAGRTYLVIGVANRGAANLDGVASENIVALCDVDPANAAKARTRFPQAAFFTDFFRLYPVHATNAGSHEHDHAWPDLTDAGRDERLAWLAGARRSLKDADGLSREEEIDRRVAAHLHHFARWPRAYAAWRVVLRRLQRRRP